MKISNGLEQSGVVVGNAYDKYNSSNRIVRWFMKGFEAALTELVDRANPSSLHEVGCGEGYWVLKWHSCGIQARGSDFSEKVIDIARENARSRDVSPTLFSVRSIYDMCPERDSADLIVCCEVLEHLEDPESGLAALQRVTASHIVLSVPREPIWCSLNIARGKYLTKLGNTPGHIQHWSSRSFIDLVSRYFEVLEIRQPLPWTMLLARPKTDAACT